MYFIMTGMTEILTATLMSTLNEISAMERAAQAQADSSAVAEASAAEQRRQFDLGARKR